MKIVSLNKKVIKLYDSIDEMPIVNFQKYNKYLLIDSGIGSDIDDIDAHITRVAKYIQLGDKKKAIMELQNMRQNIHMVNSEISPKYLAFASLIHSIDGKEITDLSDSNLKEVLQDIKTVKHSSFVNALMDIKKKVTTELELYFPEDFVKAREKEAYDVIKKRTLLVLEGITEGVDNQEQIDAIDDSIMQANIPKVFTGAESVEIKADKQFENACLVIGQKLGADAKKMTVLQFYNALDMITKQSEAELKKLRKKY